MSNSFGTLGGLARTKDEILFQGADQSLTSATTSVAFKLNGTNGGIEIVAEANGCSSTGTTTITLYEGDTADSVATTGTTLVSFGAADGIAMRFIPTDMNKKYGKIGIVSSDAGRTGTVDVFLHALGR